MTKPDKNIKSEANSILMLVSSR